MAKAMKNNKPDKSMFDVLKKQQPEPPVNEVIIKPSVVIDTDDEEIGVHFKIPRKEKRRLNKFLALDDTLDMKDYLTSLIISEMDKHNIAY